MTSDERRILREAVDARRRELEDAPAEVVPLTATGKPAQWRHGTQSGYRNGPCRCDACRAAANAARQRRRRQPNVSVHGTASSYSSGCRCDDCRAGHRVYSRDRVRKLREKVFS